MKIHRRTEIKVKLTDKEFKEALGITEEGYIQKITYDWIADYHRQGTGASVVAVELVLHRNDYHRKAAPRRKR